MEKGQMYFDARTHEYMAECKGECGVRTTRPHAHPVYEACVWIPVNALPVCGHKTA